MAQDSKDSRHRFRVAALATTNPPGERVLPLSLAFGAPARWVGDRFFEGGARIFNGVVRPSPDYLPGRAEPHIFRNHAHSLAPAITGSRFVELGPGGGQLMRLLFKTTNAVPTEYWGADFSAHNCLEAHDTLAGVMGPDRKIKVLPFDFYGDKFWDHDLWSRRGKNAYGEKCNFITIAALGYTLDNDSLAKTAELLSKAAARIKAGAYAPQAGHILMTTDNSRGKELIESSYSCEAIRQLMVSGLSYACQIRGYELPDPDLFRLEGPFDDRKNHATMTLVGVQQQSLRSTVAMSLQNSGVPPRPNLGPITYAAGERIPCGQAFKHPVAVTEKMIADSGLTVERRMTHLAAPGGEWNLWHLRPS